MPRHDYHSNKARSKASERRAARLFGGRVQPASGAINSFNLKGDVISSAFLVDDKTTKADSFTIKKDVWMKLCKEAFMNGKSPAFRIEMGDLELVLIGAQTFKELHDYFEEKVR